MGIVIHQDHRVHPNWKPFGTVSGRLSSKQQQLPSLSDPKHPALEDRVREIYVPAKGFVYGYFDISQAEMRMAANLSGDPIFMQMASEKDVHKANALLIFGAYPEAVDGLNNDIKGKGKFYRDVAKNVGFAVNYLAGDETLFLRINDQPLPRPIRMPEVRRMLAILHIKFRKHFKYIESNVDFAKANGYLRSPIAKRIRWFGWWPKPTEIANFPVQSGVADVMNVRLPLLWGITRGDVELVAKLLGYRWLGDRLRVRPREDAWRARLGWRYDDAQALLCELLPRTTGELRSTKLVAQVHDAGYFEVHEKHIAELRELIRIVWACKVKLPDSGREFLLPVDSKTATRWSDLG